jgi:hypothetical protein
LVDDMSFVPLKLADTAPNALIQLATKEHLRQAHHLLAVTYSSDGTTFDCHFGTSAAVMTLLTIDAVSSLRYFDLGANRKADPRKDKTAKWDKEAFVETVETYFPWSNVTVKDDQHRTP